MSCIKLTEVFILKEAKCPKCGNPDAYVGFASAECPNKSCSNFSQKQYDEVNKVTSAANKGKTSVSGKHQKTRYYVDKFKAMDIRNIKHFYKQERFFVYTLYWTGYIPTSDEGEIFSTLGEDDNWDDAVESALFNPLRGVNLTDPSKQNTPDDEPRSCKSKKSFEWELLIDKQNPPKNVPANSLQKYIEDFIEEAYEDLFNKIINKFP